MQLIRSLIFNIFLYIGLITIFILAIPTLVLPSKFTIFFGRLSAKYIVLILRIILNTKVIFHGTENLKKVDNYFVASAHQSMFETFALQIPLDGPIFILKKELLNIPLFGWYLRKIGSIAIVRETTTKENLNFFDKVKEEVEKSKIKIEVFWEQNGTSFSKAIETFAIKSQRDAVLREGVFIFTGSKKIEGTYLADVSGSMIAVYADEESVINSSDHDSNNDDSQ